MNSNNLVDPVDQLLDLDDEGYPRGTGNEPASGDVQYRELSMFDDDDDDDLLLDYGELDFSAPLIRVNSSQDAAQSGHGTRIVRGKMRLWMKLLLGLFGCMFVVAIASIIVYFVTTNSSYSAKEEETAKKWMDEYGIESSKRKNLMSNLEFAYSIDMTPEKENKSLKASTEFSTWVIKKQAEAKKFRWQTFKNSKTKRLFKIFTVSMALKDPADRQHLADLGNQRSNIYNKAKACVSDKKCAPKGGNETCLEIGELSVESYLEKFQGQYDCMLQVWKSWRDATGKKIKPKYIESLKLEKKGAKENNVSDPGFFEWSEDFESKTFANDMMNLYTKIRPLYEQIHAFVRHKLMSEYKGKIAADGLIPAHVLGDNWAQTWSKIIPILKIFPDAPKVNVTPVMQEKMKPKDMFVTSETFFKSIGLSPMTNDFWKKSLLEKPKDKKRVVDCHGAAYDFSNGKDFRIKMCTKINQEDLYTVHHEMGHIEYYMQYKDQHSLFQNGANSGFHEAIGDTIALSVTTPAHLRKIKLLKNENISKEKEDERDRLYLMNMALNKVVFLPFSLAVDTWRWRAANGTANEKNFNKHWWQLRSELQGLGPPVTRTEDDFDAASKYHVALGIPYIRYYVSFVIQFQFYKAMCKLSGHPADKPLHTCDFYQSKKAGAKLKEMLALGNSKPWQDAMEVLTGSREMDPAPLLEYFEPLHKWLIAENEKNKVKVGWKTPKDPLQAVSGS